MKTDDRHRVVGKLVSVQADRFTVELLAGTDNFTVSGFDDFHYIARIGSFLMIPVQGQYVVAEVIGLRERDGSNSNAHESAAELNNARSAKYLDLVPVGMLPLDPSGPFRFGVSAFPSLYADALYVLDAELDRILETGSPCELALDEDGALPEPPDATRYKALKIGESVVFAGYDVKVKIDEFFGGHAAILGNTGSGKSCTVAAVLQSLFEKRDEFLAWGATFLVFDVNGEYRAALQSLSEHGIGVNTVTLDGSSRCGAFQLPHWFLSLAEWELLLQASEKTQVPVLRTALGLTGLPKDASALATKTRQHFVAKCIIECFSDGDASLPKMQRAVSLLGKYGTDKLNLGTLRKHRANDKYGNFDPPGSLSAFLDELRGHLIDDIALPQYRNAPFSFADLEDALDFALLYEEAHGNRQIRDYCSQMMTRFKALRDNEEYNFLKVDPASAGVPTETEFTMSLLGLVRDGPTKLHKQDQITIINMNAVDDEVVELVAAVLARIIFRLLRQATPRNRFPVHLILEESHRYISENPSGYSIDAGRIFERIAKEGRKYGLFLQVASQRPSELSKTVLSQCSNFIVHRIQNPDDLTHIRQMTPFISDAVLKRLPSLPRQHALVFGNAVSLPITFKVRSASPTPESGDAKIRHLWFRPWHRSAQISLSGYRADADYPGE
ncbi:ATPase [Rhizobium sp. Root564]|nr:ATPase [Rhizobium sp. Root564]